MIGNPTEKCKRCDHTRNPHGCCVYVGAGGRKSLCSCSGFEGEEPSGSEVAAVILAADRLVDAVGNTLHLAPQEYAALRRSIVSLRLRREKEIEAVR